MQRGAGHMLFVIAAGIVSLAVCTTIAVLLIHFSRFALGGTITTILLACFFIWWLRQWWQDRMEKYEDYASANEIEYLEELAEEHKRGAFDHGERSRLLLPRFATRNAKALEQYKNRLDNIRLIIG